MTITAGQLREALAGVDDWTPVHVQEKEAGRLGSPVQSLVVLHGVHHTDDPFNRAGHWGSVVLLSQEEKP
jgi:hypothetical protein